MADAMHYRMLGRTGLQVSTIGFGAWGIGGTMWIGATEDASLAALRHAVDLEYTFFDTALVYGAGNSERLVGQVYRERKGTTPAGRPIIIASKVPPKNLEWPARPGVAWKETFPADHIIAMTERSLKHLGVETIHLQQFHVWQDQWLEGLDEWGPALEKLRRQGKVQHWGISINDFQPDNALQAVASGLFDTVQVIYNIFEQTPEAALFPACQKYNVGVIARVPLDEGGLTGQITPTTQFPDADFRNHYFHGERKREVVERVGRLQPLVRESGCHDLAELALRFCTTHPAVATVIPGMRSVARVEANAQASDAGPLSPAVVEKLRGHRWVKNWYR